MKKINIYDDYNHIKLMQSRHVNELITKIENSGGLGNEKEIELNIEDCVTNYPSTPMLIDYFLNHLSHFEGEKNLVIKLGGLGNKEIYILFTLVLGGEFFNIHDKIENDDEIVKWKEIINKKLKEKKIVLRVLYTPDRTEYTYGN